MPEIGILSVDNPILLRHWFVSFAGDNYTAYCLLLELQMPQICIEAFAAVSSGSFCALLHSHRTISVTLFATALHVP